MKIQTRPRQTVSVDGYIHSIETMGTVDGPGVRYIVFMQGCPLRCLYCHNPDSLKMKRGKLVASGKLLDHIQGTADFLKRAKGGVTLSGGEPFVQPEFMASILRGCKEMKLHTAVDTTGHLGPNISDEILADIDLVLLDLKSFEPRIYRHVTGAEIAPTLAFAQRLEALGKPMWVRFVLVPGLTDDPANLNALADYVATLRMVQRVEVIPFHKMGEFKWQALGLEYTLSATQPPTPQALEAARQVFAQRGLNVA